MASKGDTQVNTFVGGLITEASPLLFPENASFDEINFKLKKDGTRERRLGLNYEDNFVANPIGLTAVQMPISKQKFFRWETPGGSANVEIGIVQVGHILWFIDLFSSSPSTALLNSGNSISLDILSISSVYDFAIVNNDVILVSDKLDSPYTLVYDEDTDVVTASTLNIEIRDLYGIFDNHRVDERPVNLTTDHEYNLRNQGWSSNITTTCASLEDALACTKDVLGKYPSNSDIWSLGKIEDVASADVDKYDPDTLVKNSVDLGLAAKGHFIIDAYDRGASRSAESGILVDNVDRELGKISTVATYAGRAFYSGIRSKVLGGDQLSPKNGGSVFFSQVVRNASDFVKCYQDADPTSTEISDIVDTDGGVIAVLGATNIIKLMTVKQSLFVFAQNGVWEIKGDDLGFKATGFQVNRLTTVGALSRDSIIETNGSVLYWATEGIFSLAPDQFGTSWDATNLTLATIQTLYDSIPNAIKESVRGYYDQGQNQVRWLYQSDSPKIIGQPVDITDFLPGIGETSEVADGIGPAVAKLTNTTALIIYRKSVGQALKGKVTTVNEDLSLSYGAEQDLGMVSGGGGHTITHLSNNKLLLVSPTTVNKLEARILNISGETVSLGATSVINSETTASATALNRVALIDTTKAVVSYLSNAGGIPALQVININALDVITWGAVFRNPNMAGAGATTVTMLSATSGIMMSSATKSFAEHFTLSGTTITFNGTLYSFLTGTQLAGTLTYTNGTIHAIGLNRALVHGLLTNSTGFSSVPTSFIMTETSGVLTGGDILIDGTSEVTQLTSYVMGAQSVSLSRDFVSGAQYVPRVSSATLFDPQVAANKLDFPVHTTVGFPEGGVVTNNILVGAWEGTATGLIIEAGAVRI